MAVGGQVESEDDVGRYAEAGVDRLIVSPWARTRDVPEALARFAGRFLG